MKRKRNLIILACALLVVCGIIVVEKAITHHVDRINTIDEIILSVRPEDLTSVTWTYKDKSLTFLRNDGVWQSGDDAEFPVNQEILTNFLNHFKEVHASFIIDDVEDYDQYGLKNPQCTVVLKTEEGETKVSMGGYSTMDSKRYITVGDGKVYLIDVDLLQFVTNERDAFMQHDRVPDIDKPEELTISGDTSLHLVYDTEGVYTYTDAYHYYDTSTGTYRMLKDSLVESFVGKLTGMSLTDYVTYKASTVNLADYGLDSPARTIWVRGPLKGQKNKENPETGECRLHIGVVDTGKVDDEGKPVMEYYLRFDGSEIIYRLTSSLYETLSGAGYNSLRPPEVVTLDWEDEVTGFSFTFDGKQYAVTREKTDKEGKEAFVYKLEGQEIQADNIISAINALTVNTFQDDAPRKSKELSVTIRLNKEDYPSLSIELYQHDGENCIARLNGEVLGLVSRSLMVDLREALASAVLNLES